MARHVQGTILMERAKRMIAGGTPNDYFRWKDQEILRAVQEVCNAIVKRRFLENLKLGDTDVENNYLSVYEEVPVLKSTTQNKFYSVLPARVIPLPDGKEVYQVSLTQDQENSFLPCSAGVYQVYGDVNNEMYLDGNIGFYQEANKIYYVNMIPSDSITSVMMKLVVDRRYLDENQDYILADQENEVVNTVFQQFMPPSQKSEDKSNNGVSN